MHRAASLIIALMFPPAAMAAEAGTELSFYGIPGLSGLGDPGAGGPADTAQPAQQGMRLTFWQERGFGWGVELNNSSAVADAGPVTAAAARALSYQDNLSLLTLNAYRRTRQPFAGLEPYLGAGLGVAMPHSRGAGGSENWQLGGPAVQVMAGARFSLGAQVSVFGEYQGSYSVNLSDPATGGADNGTVGSSVNMGVSLGF